jgi:hypothetical protein
VRIASLKTASRFDVTGVDGRYGAHMSFEKYHVQYVQVVQRRLQGIQGTQT